jgi:hypothetical protein
MMKKRRFIAVLITLVVFVWHCGDKEIASDDVMGLWKTSAPKYADRSFEITKERITFGKGEGNFEIDLIKKIHMKQFPQDKSRLYTIYYEDDKGEENTFAFYYYHENGGVIRLKNQREIEWKKDQDNR